MIDDQEENDGELPVDKFKDHYASLEIHSKVLMPYSVIFYKDVRKETNNKDDYIHHSRYKKLKDEEKMYYMLTITPEMISLFSHSHFFDTVVLDKIFKADSDGEIKEV